MKTKQGTPNTNTELSTITEESPALGIDLMIFAHHLKGSGLNEAQQAEYLMIFWQIASAFADLGHGLDPVQTACGKGSQNTEKAESLLQNMVLSEEFQSSRKEEIKS